MVMDPSRAKPMQTYIPDVPSSMSAAIKTVICSVGIVVLSDAVKYVGNIVPSSVPG